MWGWLFGRAKLGGLPRGTGWRWWWRTWEGSPTGRGECGDLRGGVEALGVGVEALFFECMGCRLGVRNQRLHTLG